MKPGNSKTGEKMEGGLECFLPSVDVVASICGDLARNADF